MADPVATVEKIVKIGLKIKEAVDKARHNEDECREITRRVLRFSAILSQLQQTGMVNDSPAMAGALEDLEETLEQALKLVAACQERATIRRLIAAGDLSKQLRRVKDDILNKVMLASFAINAQATIVLLTIQAGGRATSRPPQDTGVTEISHSVQSTNDPRSEVNGEKNKVRPGSEPPFATLFELRKFSLSELEAAMNGNDLIGEGGACMVYKGLLNDGTVVAIKKFKFEVQAYPRPRTDLLFVAKLQHKNIVKILGYMDGVDPSMKQKTKYYLLHGMKYIWVEEYMPNGNLNQIIQGSELNWSSLSRIIQGIAQGIHYLHEQRVVHMDVKPHNIILDSDMNPKITDLELCIELHDNEITDDDGIMGTMGYAAPEYIAAGIISTKNDVYAFGITILETISSMCRCKPPRGLVHQWVWVAWKAGQTMEDLYPELYEVSDLKDIRRYMQIGLLCAQLDRARRPDMTKVLEMLNGNKKLPNPKKP